MPPDETFSVRREISDCAAAASDEVASGDWFICGGERGVEKAPVDWRWRVSKISCSPFGRRGGEGPVDWGNEVNAGASLRWRGVVETLRVAREKRWALGAALRE